MYCMNCGTENNTDARFCTGCGRLLRIRAGQNGSSPGYRAGGAFADWQNQTSKTAPRRSNNRQKKSIVGGTVMTVIGMILFVFSAMIFSAISHTYEYRMGYLDYSEQCMVTMIVLFIIAGITLSVLGVIWIIKRLHN